MNSDISLLPLPGHQIDEDDEVRVGNIVPDDAPVGLKRQVGLLGLITFLVGSIIGSGIFASPSVVAMYAGSSGLLLVTWVAGGLIAMLGAVTYCELALTFPDKCGNDYSYIYEAFGDFPSFVVSYIMILMGPILSAMMGIVAGDYIITAVTGHGDSLYSKVIAAGIIGINMLFNCYSVKWVERVQILFTGAKMIPIAMLVVSGLVRIGQGHTEDFKDAFNGSATGVSDITLALYGGLFSYGGWDSINFVTAEAINPVRNFPIAIAIGIPLVTLCYVMVNITYLTLKTPLQIAESSAVAVDIAEDLYGVMHWVIPVLVACSVYGACNSGSFAISRLIYEASNRKHLPKILGSVHLTRHTPIPAIIFSSVLAWLILIPEASNFGSLLNSLTFVAWTKTLLVIAALLWMRRSKPNIKRPFKVFIIIPILLFVIGAYLVVTPFVRYPVEQSIGLCIILPSVPLYLVFIKYQILPQTWIIKSETLTQKIQYFCNLGSPVYEDKM